MQLLIAEDERRVRDFISRGLTEEGFLTPSTFSLVKHGKKQEMKHAKARFDASGLEVTQHFVSSKDGTRIPYFQIGKQNAPLDGTTPTLIEGYGGFEISETPFYSGALGIEWFDRRGPHRAQGHEPREARDQGWIERWPARRRDDDRAPRVVRCGRVLGTAARHEALQQAARRRIVDGRVR